MAEAQDIVEQLTSLVGYKDKNGNYNKLKDSNSVRPEELVTGFRDKKIIKCVDPEGGQ